MDKETEAQSQEPCPRSLLSKGQGWEGGAGSQSRTLGHTHRLLLSPPRPPHTQTLAPSQGFAGPEVQKRPARPPAGVGPTSRLGDTAA